MEDRFAVGFQKSGEEECGSSPLNDCRVLVDRFGDHDSERY